MQAHLKLVGEFLEPWISRESTNIRCYGIQCNMVKYLTKSMNFTYELIDDRTGNGFQLKNGIWTGVLGRFERGVNNLIFSLVKF